VASGGQWSKETERRYKFARNIWIRPEAYRRVKEYCDPLVASGRYETQTDCVAEVVLAGLAAVTGQAQPQTSSVSGVEVACKAKKEGGIYVVRCGGKTFLFSQAKLHELVEKGNLVVELEEQP